MRVPPLTEAEKNRWYSKFFYERYEPAPEALAEIGDNGPMGLENAVSVADRLTVVRDGYFNRERGWQVMPDGTTFVAGFIFMKDVTPDMFQWWFSWMPVDGLRPAVGSGGAFEPGGRSGIHQTDVQPRSECERAHLRQPALCCGGQRHRL